MEKRDQQQGKPELRPTPVVTCFLMRFDGPGPRVLIVQRSQRVGSYQGQWGGISGFIEPGVSPDAQAYTEVREETGLLPDEVCMLRRGEVVPEPDSAIGREFLVHPFIFEVYKPDKIRTDWEAVQMRWIPPSEIKDYNTVPKLWEAYQSAMNGAIVQA
ncbi:MAG TPA: NUDIX pyrophosphatase [Ktedonobacteraceae bacterium]|nr:NUDIX pyrophosphatase [Ktedonobacteraceae bacterium]